MPVFVVTADVHCVTNTLESVSRGVYYSCPEVADLVEELNFELYIH